MDKWVAVLRPGPDADPPAPFLKDIQMVFGDLYGPFDSWEEASNFAAETDRGWQVVRVRSAKGSE